MYLCLLNLEGPLPPPGEGKAAPPPTHTHHFCEAVKKLMAHLWQQPQPADPQRSVCHCCTLPFPGIPPGACQVSGGGVVSEKQFSTLDTNSAEAAEGGQMVVVVGPDRRQSRTGGVGRGQRG